MFDYIHFFDRHNIPYITTGKVGRGDVGIPCPFCGPSDQGYNLSVSVKGLGFYCWRRPQQHRGRTPHRLIQELLHCSYVEADSYVSSGVLESPADQQLLDSIRAIDRREREAETVSDKLELPDEFRPIRDYGTTRMFFNYLRRRGFKDPEWLIDEFGLRCCTTGRFAGRVILPIEMDHELVSWTGRHIGSSSLRYDTLPVPPARLSNKKTLLWYDKLANVDTVIVTEGPLDALKINYLAGDNPVFATCIYGKNVSDEQVDLLLSLRCRHKIILFDTETREEHQHFSPDSNTTVLQNNGFEFRYLPEHIPDPGELDKDSFRQLWSDSRFNTE